MTRKLSFIIILLMTTTFSFAQNFGGFYNDVYTLAACANNGVALFDLTSGNESFGKDKVILFFETEEDALSEVNPIITAATYNGTQKRAVFMIVKDKKSGSGPIFKINLLKLKDCNLSTKNNVFTALKMYPNPVSNGTLNVSVSGVEKGAFSISNAQGQQLLATVLAFNNGEAQLNIAHLTTGVYFATLQSGKKRVVKKLIVN